VLIPIRVINATASCSCACRWGNHGI
jgi:hypothetical protein